MGVHLVIKSNEKGVAFTDGRCSEVAGAAEYSLHNLIAIGGTRGELENLFTTGNTDQVSIFHKIPPGVTGDGIFFGVNFNVQFTLVFKKSKTCFFA